MCMCVVREMRDEREREREGEREREMRERETVKELVVVMGSYYDVIIQDIEEVVSEEPKVGGMEEVMQRRLKERYSMWRDHKWC